MMAFSPEPLALEDRAIFAVFQIAHCTPDLLRNHNLMYVFKTQLGRTEVRCAAAAEAEVLSSTTKQRFQAALLRSMFEEHCKAASLSCVLSKFF
jgi:hypothetical protein